MEGTEVGLLIEVSNWARKVSGVFIDKTPFEGGEDEKGKGRKDKG